MKPENEKQECWPQKAETTKEEDRATIQINYRDVDLISDELWWRDRDWFSIR